MMGKYSNKPKRGHKKLKKGTGQAPNKREEEFPLVAHSPEP